MLLEIGEAPAVAERILASVDERRAVAAAISKASPRWVMIAGRGTSDHAGVYAQYLVEARLGLLTGLVKPSITTIYRAELDWRGGLVLAISQSGRSPDIVAVVEAARRSGALTLAITNDPGSPLAEAAELQLDLRAGPELAVPATKTYVAELVVVAALVNELTEGGPLDQGLARLPGALARTLDVTTTWLAGPGRPDVTTIAAADRALLVSRGYNLATSLELALKLKETVGLYAEAYSTADFAHGPRALTREDVPVVAIRPDGPMGGLVDETLTGVRALGAPVTLIGGRETVADGSALVLPDEVLEELSPVPFVVAGQLLVEAVARERGVDPDAPSGLAKVTLTH
jgi:glucosamine--fructose-6-phosphate aminotransferase (isomerizing)